jgi:hypothetical protein
MVELGDVGEQRLAPLGKRPPAVAFRHVHGEIRVDVDRREGEARASLLRPCRRRRHERARAHRCGAGPERDDAPEEPAPGQRPRDHAVEIAGLGAGIAHLVELVERQVPRVDVFHQIRLRGVCRLREIRAKNPPAGGRSKAEETVNGASSQKCDTGAQNGSGACVKFALGAAACPNSASDCPSRNIFALTAGRTDLSVQQSVTEGGMSALFVIVGEWRAGR